MRNSIRTRLTVAFIGLAIGPLLLVGIILAWQSFTTQERQALNLQREVARRVATEVTAFFTELENELHLMSKAQMWPGLGRNAPHSTLSLLMSQDVFEELVLLDNQGQEQIHLSRLAHFSTTLSHPTEADEFVIPQTTGKAYYSPVRFDETAGEPLMTIAVPLLNVRTGQSDGVLVAEARLKKIWNLIADVRVGPGQSVYIIDAQNKIVAHRNPSVVLRGTTFAVPNQDGIQPGLNGSSTVLAVDTVRFGQQEFNVVAEQAVPDALVLAINSVYLIGATIVVALVIASSLGFLIVRQIVWPIQTMATTAQAISAGDLSQQVAITSRDELGILANAFNSMTTQLRTLIDSLEQRVTRRTQQIETVAEISQQLTSILDLPTLLCEVVTMTKETFGYYHVHIYVLAEESKTLIMAEGYGEAGTKMKQQGHQIPLDAPTSLVARAARQREIVLVDDVRQAPDWLPNPLLPDTYSEMAVPIIAEDKIIGVLDVQSDQVAGLDKGDMDLLRSLANQVAVALTNAQLYKTEKDLRQIEAQRAQELAQLNADLRATQTELLRQERLATLGKLTATVSHEIRNPLATIRASAFALDRKTRHKELGVERALDRIERNITRCDNIITELLDYTRIGNLTPQPVLFDEWLQQVLDEQTLPAGISLEVDLAAGVEVPLDPERFRRVIVNLVENACQAMQEEANPNRSEQVLSVQSEVMEGQIRLSIADTGPGIPPEVMSNIFEPLYSTKSFGVGLGLPVVQEIINQHGGKIEINSEAGAGTQVMVWLPLV
jgi:signal transduction histidine kinase/HAMP domain-containing protein